MASCSRYDMYAFLYKKEMIVAFLTIRNRKTTARREEYERGTILDIKNIVFRHHPDCIFHIYVKGWQDDKAKD